MALERVIYTPVVATDALCLHVEGEDLYYRDNSGNNIRITAGGSMNAAPAGTNVGGNPTASVGLAAVNGTALNYMRSDAAPALSQTIVPTWIGKHTFNNGVVLGPGGTAAGTAPIKLTTQAAGLTVVEQGAFELIVNTLCFTNLAVRRSVVQAQSVRTTAQTVANTVTETEIFTQTQGANYLTVGKMLDVRIYGEYSSVQGAGSNTATFRVKWGGSTIATWTTAESNQTNTQFEIVVIATCRSIGVTGTMRLSCHCHIDNVQNSADTGVLQTINTTIAQALSVTVQWSDAKAGNSIVVQQARGLAIDNNP